MRSYECYNVRVDDCSPPGAVSGAMTVRYHGRECEVVGVYVGRPRTSGGPALCYVLRQDIGGGLCLTSPNLDGRDANRPKTNHIGQTDQGPSKRL